MQGVDMGNCFVGPWDIANDASDVRQPVESALLMATDRLGRSRLAWCRDALPTHEESSICTADLLRSPKIFQDLPGHGAPPSERGCPSFRFSRALSLPHAGSHERELRRRLRQRLQL
jgi:hypothetical protein